MTQLKDPIKQTIAMITPIEDKLDEALIRCDAIFRSLELLVSEYMQAELDITLEQGLMYQLTDVRELINTSLQELETLKASEREQG